MRVDLACVVLLDKEEDLSGYNALVWVLKSGVLAQTSKSCWVGEP